MATRSTLSKVNSQTGEVFSVYCHWDGYLEHNGRMLLEHYNSEDRAIILLSMGAISALNETIDDSIFYCRDRGEDWDTVKPNRYENWAQFINTHRGEEFDYVFVDNEWHLFNDVGGRTPLSHLEELQDAGV